MSIRAIVVWMSVMAAIPGAFAQDRRPQARFAAVDAAGRIVPMTSEAQPPQRLESPSCRPGFAITAAEARALVFKIATEEDFYPEFVLSVAKTESRFDALATSDKGAFGLMQLMPDTAQRFKVDLCDPASNVRGGVRYLRALHEKYKNPFFILAAYNAGEEAVDKSRGVPPYPETVRFVAEVMNDFYVWPVPGEGASHGRRSRTAAAPDLIEPRSQASTSQPAEPAAQSRSGDGFVMHFD